MSKAVLAKKYQSMTAQEHVFNKPDTYIGATEEDSVNCWVKSDDEDTIEYKTINWVPGLYKCFDEALVNARDHVVRMELLKEKKKILVKNISVECDKAGVITIRNDGNGIDIAKHPKDKIWIPEMIFMHLRTSTNYDDEEKKLVGGKNGFGIKLVFIFAKYGVIETVDHIRKLKYTQRVENNLTVIHPPVITKYTGKPYTQVQWLPDYERFGLKDGLTDGMRQLLSRRVYDIAGITDKTLTVKYQKKVIDIKSFEQYVNCYIGDTERVFQETERWQIVVTTSQFDEYSQVSFVNGISTGKGGKHVDYILNQITKKMVEYIKRKKKITVKPVTIKEQLLVFVNCMVENPAFDSQTKDYLNTPVSKFGSKIEISDKLIDKLAKMGVMDAAISLNEVKENKLAKKTDGKKSRTIRGIPKLIDANKAGGPNSDKCVLILCEGDSAKAGIMSGLTTEDRDTIGIFPLKGKLLNVRDASIGKINNNAEITAIKKIMGLQAGKKYTDKKEMKNLLRYGQIIFMTDQDLDGEHIKGLCMNMFNSQWPELFKMKGFLGYMNTPIIKAKKGKRVKNFYDESEYEIWKKANDNGKGWKIKYYKGLGTSTGKEFKQYFANKKFITFKCETEEDEDAMDKAFNKLRADDRKVWLSNYDKDRRLETKNKEIHTCNFIDDGLIHFSKYDCERSIGNAIDGLKTSQRKILYSAFKRNLQKEIKVAQFAGYVSEHSGYHHGENSLNMAIVKLAQEYTGSNNINLLHPGGQFGSRLKGGEDSASERYIHTHLGKLTRKIFREEDDKILTYRDDDGTMVEPEYYLPIIPMILVNGGKGIGTGFSMDVQQYNVIDIINNLKDRLKNKPESKYTKINSYYEGFKGKIIEIEAEQKIIIKGCYRVLSHDTIHITELPIGMWTVNYKTHLESLMDTSRDKKTKKEKQAIIKNYKDDCTDATINFTVRFQPGVLSLLLTKKYDENINMLEKTMKLYTSKRHTNMYLFNDKEKLKKFETINEIVDKYYPVRKEGYVERKKYLLSHLEKKMNTLSNKARFISEIMQGTIVLVGKKKQQVIELLDNKKYKVIDDDKDYKYLRSLPVDSMEEENYKKLKKEESECQQEYVKLKKLSVEEMWLSELVEFEKCYKKYQVERKDRVYGKLKTLKKTKKKKK